MNTIYRLVWSDQANSWTAVAVTVRGKSKVTTRIGRSSEKKNLPAAQIRFPLKVLVLSVMSALGLSTQVAAEPAANQLPTGGTVVAGSATINAAGSTLNIDQTTQRAAVDWQSFDVGRSAQVNFNQPSSDSVTLNRIQGNNASQIFGQINANGQVFLTNPQGIYFSPTASVNVGGLVATTHSITNEDFMAGSTTFDRAGAEGSIINEGELTSIDGYIALLAPEVRNEGVILAQAGTVALAAGEQISLQFSNGGLTGVNVTQGQIDALVENRLAVEAPDGLIILSAQAAHELQGSVINTATGTRNYQRWR